MKRPAIIVLAIACFALGAVAQRYYDTRRPAREIVATVQPPPAVPATPAVDFASEPLWAYGFDTVSKPGDKAAPQAPPNRSCERTRTRRADPAQDESRAAPPRTRWWTSATAPNVIDWFPRDHPTPCPTSSRTVRPDWAS